MRKPGGDGSGRGAATLIATVCPARRRRAADRARARRRRRPCRSCTGGAPRPARAREAGGAAPPPASRRPRAAATARHRERRALSHEPARRRAPAPRRGAAARTAPLRHVGAPAALAADRLRDFADDLAGVEPARPGRASPSRRARSCRPRRRPGRSTPEPQLVAQLIGHVAQRLGVGDVGARGEHARRRSTSRASATRSRPPPEASLRRSFSISLSLLAQLGLQLGDARGDLKRRRAEQLAGLAQLVLELAHVGRARPRR